MPLAQIWEPVGCCCYEELESICITAWVPAGWAIKLQKGLSQSKIVKVITCFVLSIDSRHAWTTHRWRSPQSDIICWPSRGTSLAAHLSASFLLHLLVTVLVFVFVIVIMLFFRSQRTEEERRQEEVSLQFPGCLYGDQPSSDGHLCLNVLCVLHCHHCPVK